jgi:hypothetical protein
MLDHRTTAAGSLALPAGRQLSRAWRARAGGLFRGLEQSLFSLQLLLQRHSEMRSSKQ